MRKFIRKVRMLRRSHLSENSDGGDGRMSIFGHLGELRRRIAIVGFLFLLALIGSFFIIREMADYLLIIGLRSGFSFVYLAPSELVSSYFKLSITTGLCVSLPLALYQLWCFITPALTASQRKSGYKALLGGLCLFILGVLFAYTVTLPAMLGFLVNFNTSEHINPSISVSEFLNFVLGVLLVFGLILRCRCWLLCFQSLVSLSLST